MDHGRPTVPPLSTATPWPAGDAQRSVDDLAARALALFSALLGVIVLAVALLLPLIDAELDARLLRQ